MRTRSLLVPVRAILLAGAVAVGAPAVARAQQPMLDVTRFANELGLTVVEPAAARRITIGDAVTAAAGEPLLLHRIGITGMHRGARVVIARVAADHVLVEVDEMHPAPAKASVRLAVGTDGVLRLP